MNRAVKVSSMDHETSWNENIHTHIYIYISNIHIHYFFASQFSVVYFAFTEFPMEGETQKI